MGSM